MFHPFLKSPDGYIGERLLRADAAAALYSERGVAVGRILCQALLADLDEDGSQVTQLVGARAGTDALRRAVRDEGRQVLATDLVRQM